MALRHYSRWKRGVEGGGQGGGGVNQAESGSDFFFSPLK